MRPFLSLCCCVFFLNNGLAGVCFDESQLCACLHALEDIWTFQAKHILQQTAITHFPNLTRTLCRVPEREACSSRSCWKTMLFVVGQVVQAYSGFTVSELFHWKLPLAAAKSSPWERWVSTKALTNQSNELKVAETLHRAEAFLIWIIVIIKISIIASWNLVWREITWFTQLLIVVHHSTSFWMLVCVCGLQMLTAHWLLSTFGIGCNRISHS